MMSKRTKVSPSLCCPRKESHSSVASKLMCCFKSKEQPLV